MPCSNMSGVSNSAFAEASADEAKRLARQAMAKADQVADMLCRTLQAMPKEQIEKLDSDVLAWLAAHLRHDAQQGRVTPESAALEYWLRSAKGL